LYFSEKHTRTTLACSTAHAIESSSESAAYTIQDRQIRPSY